MINDEKLREAYERGLPQGDDRPPLDDLAGERLRRLVEREGSDAERLHTVDALLSSADGRRELEIAWAAERAARPRSRGALLWRIAAGVLVMVGIPGLLVLTTRDDQPSAARGDASPVVLVAPLGTSGAQRAGHFLWRAVATADRYTLVVVDANGNEVFARETGDTAVTLPDSVSLRTGNTYLWWVQAHTRMGESLTAVTQRVRIEGR